MKLKSYFQFIKESKSIDKNIWTLSEDEIYDYLIDFVQSKYIINIDFGFVERFLKEDKTLKNVFNEDLKKYGGEETPAYFITIIPERNSTPYDDLTDSLHFACDNFRDLVGHDNLFGGDFELYDDNGNKLNIDDIVVKKGFFTKTDDGLLKNIRYIGILIIENKKVKITAKDFSEYYGWKYDELKGDMVYAHVSLEDMVNTLLAWKSPYRKHLINGIDNEYYWSGDYQPDTSSLFEYILDEENSILLVKKVMEEIGGLEKTIEEIRDKSVKDMTEEQLIDFLLKERFYRTLDSLCEDSEIVGEVKEICGDWEMDACVDQLWDEFIEIVDDEIKQYEIIDKEVTKYHKTPSGEKKEYKEFEKFFSIPLNNDWMENMDHDYKMQLSSVRDVFNEWTSDMGFNYDLSPDFSSTGDVDLIELNKEIRSILV